MNVWDELWRYAGKAIGVGRLGTVSSKRIVANMEYCTCCRQKVAFKITGPWLRDQYICLSCGSIPRQRALNLMLDTYFPQWAKLEIHESSPSNDFVARWCERYTKSQFYDNAPLGGSIHGIRCENLERLSFEDERFDIFITQDVMEHVFHPEKAIKEIMRVLKPGGAHVFTTPKHKSVRQSYRRAIIKNGKVQHLLEPQYHGNPIGDGRALVTWDYGDDFEVLLWQWCGYPTATFITKDRQYGIDGEYLEVFITRKIGLTAD
jgi:SAM-dependent methyltransferase